MKSLEHEPKASERWLTGLLKKVADGRLPVTEAVKELRVLPYEDMLHAKIDHHRGLRTGFPEVIYGPGKTLGQLLGILSRMSGRSWLKRTRGFFTARRQT